MSTTNDTELDATIRRLTGEQVANAPATPDFESIMTRADTGSEIAGPGTQHRTAVRRRTMLVAAATVLVVAGLAWTMWPNGEPSSVATVGTDSEPTDPTVDSSTEAADPTAPTTINEADDASSGAPLPDGVVPIDTIVEGGGRPLAEVTELSREEWVLPTVMIDGYDYRFAAREFGQMVTFGPAGSEQEQLMIGIASDTFGAVSGDEEITVAGEQWSVDGGDEYWNATHRVGSAYVSVGGAGLDDAAITAIIESLQVVTTEEMAVPPLAGPDDQVAVATFDDDGTVTTMFADEANGWFATSTRSAMGSSSSGGGTPFDPVDVISSPTSGGFGYGEGATSIDVETSAIVAAEVAVVEVEFLDGSVVTVEPTDLSGEFDVKFFAITANVDLEGRSPDRVGSAVVEMRGFDADGVLLGTERSDEAPFMDEPSAVESGAVTTPASDDPDDSAVPETTTP